MEIRGRWTEYQDAFLRDALGKGHKPEDIARALGRDRKAVLKRMGRTGLSWRVSVALLEKKEEAPPIEAPQPEDGKIAYDPLADALMKAGYEKRLATTKSGDFAPVTFHPDRPTGLGQWD